MRRPRIIIYGAGMMGRLSARYAREKGAEIVAFYRRSVVPQDAGIRQEFPEAAFCTPDILFTEHEADVALLTHCTRLGDLKDSALQSALAGLDALTIAEHAYEPFYPDADLAIAEEIENAFCSAGKTLVSVGVQDSFWYSQPMAFLSAVQSFTKLEGRNTADLSLFGYASKPPAYIGLSEEEFYAGQHHMAEQDRGTFEVALRPLIRALGREIKAIERCYQPMMTTTPIDLPACGISLASGKTRGRAEITRFILDNGSEISGIFERCYMPAGEHAMNEWRVEGLPSMNMRTDNFQGDVITSAALVNRIPDVIAAKPGFLSVSELAPARFHDDFTKARERACC